MANLWVEDEESRNHAEEQRVKYAALDSFQRYRRTAHYNVTHRRRQNFYALPQAHWQLLSSPPFDILGKFDRVDDAIETNAAIAAEISRFSFETFAIDPESDGWKDTAKPADVDKARSTIRQFYRDWSAEGEVERRACYGPVLRELAALYGNVSRRDKARVLVPGCGLGRLVVEICALGFVVEGNELSYHQLMAGNWVLNGTKVGKSYELYPWVFSFSNQVSREIQLRSVRIPDIHPGAYLNHSSVGKIRHAFERMAMSAADFCTHYATPEARVSFEVVTTVYFIDTAPNPIRYIEAIKNALVPGGYWINLGPLLWHFEDRAPGSSDDVKVNDPEPLSENMGIGEPGSVELTSEELKTLVQHMGFEILKSEVSDVRQGYMQDTSSMIQTSYNVLFFVARKIKEV